MSAAATKFPPTPEQQEILRFFATGENLAIEAGAGTGKTSTLVMIGESTTRRGQYIVFNRKMKEEAARRFPTNVACRTAHSLAYAPVGHRFKTRIDARIRMRSSEVAKILGVDGKAVYAFTGERKWLSAAKLAGIAKATVIGFCQSADAEITRYHVPLQKGLDAPGDRNRPVQREIAEYVLPFARKIWADGIDPAGILPYDMAYYLKLWERSSPRINADFVLFDEAQDASPVMLSIIDQQPERVQRVFVGDSQQQIYSFTGAVNALARIREKGGNVAYLTKSFRFGPAVAEVANGVLDRLQAELRIVGHDPIESTVGPVESPDAILTRTNAEAVRELLAAIDRGQRAYLEGSADEVLRFAKAAEQLQAGQRADHPDLYLFETWAQVIEYVEYDEQGGDLRLLVKLITEFGARVIIEAIEQMPPAHQADIAISTAHKSKGLEWEQVKLGGDFPADAAGEELRLLYVAVTRARLRLDITALPTLAPDDDAPDAAEATQEPTEAPAGPQEPTHAPTDGPAGNNGVAAPAEALPSYIVVADGQKLGEYSNIRAAESTALGLHRGGSFASVNVIDNHGELVSERHA